MVFEGVAFCFSGFLWVPQVFVLDFFRFLGI